MANPKATKADVLRAIATELDWWRAMLDAAGSGSPLTDDEDVDGTWSFKELLAHIDGWRSWTLARFEAAASGGDPVAPWPAEMSEDDEGVDEINAWFKQQSHTRSLDEVIATSTKRLERLHDVVAQVPSADLLTPGRFVRLGSEFADLPLGPALIGFSVTHVHGEHAPALEAWLAERLGQHVELPPEPQNFGYED